MEPEKNTAMQFFHIINTLTFPPEVREWQFRQILRRIFPEQTQNTLPPREKADSGGRTQ